MELLSNEEALKWYSPERAGLAPQAQAPQKIDPADVADIAADAEDGNLELLNIPSNTRPVGVELPAEKVVDILSKGVSPLSARVNYGAETLKANLSSLKNSLNVNPFEIKSLAEQAGVSYYTVDEDPAFARKKIESDKYRESLSGFMRNMDQTPKTWELLRQMDAMEQLALTNDVDLMVAEKDWREREMGFFESGYLASAWQAFQQGKLGREVGELALKWMQGTLTEDDRARLDVLRRAQEYFGREQDMGLLEKMVRGTVGSLGVPLYGGIEGAGRFLAAYGKEALTAGAGLGAMYGSAAGGLGAIPGAIAGALSGLSATALTGFAEDMMRQEGAQTFLTLKDMGVPDDTARLLAIGAGAAKGALEYVGLKTLGKLFPGVEGLLTRKGLQDAVGWLEKNPQVQKALGSNVAAMLKAGLGEVATEVSQTGVDILAEEAGRRISGVPVAAPTTSEIIQRVGETITETLTAVALPVLTGGGARAAHGAWRNQQYSRALESLGEHQASIFDSIARVAQNSEVLQKMPGTGQEFLRALADAGVAPKEIFIKPEKIQEVFFQDQNQELMAAAQAMGITPESLAENFELGTDVAVNLEKATAQIFNDEGRYQALRKDMRLHPEMPSEAGLEEMRALEADAEARAAWLEDILGPVAEEAATAQNRYDTRMDIARPFVEQLQGAGYTQNQAEAYGLLLAANAERMAPIFGQSPGAYLQDRLAGFYEMSQQEFEQLGDLSEEQRLAEVLQEMGVKKGMSKTARHKALSPEFAYVYGKVSRQSVESLYGKDFCRELVKQYGPRFFAKKGEGRGLDQLALSFSIEERNGYDANRNDVDMEAFAETVFMPDYEFEERIKKTLGKQAFWHAALPAPQVQVKGDEIFNAKNPFPKKIAERRNAIIQWLENKGWLKSFKNKATGWDIEVNKSSVRNTSMHGLGERKAQVFAALPKLISNAVYIDEGKAKKEGHKRHIFAVKTRIADKDYVVGIVVNEDPQGRKFYDHELTEIERLDSPLQHGAQESAITGRGEDQALSVLEIIRRKLAVKPSLLDEGSLFQTAPAPDSQAFKEWFGNSKVVVFDEKAVKVLETFYQAQEYEEGGGLESEVAQWKARVDEIVASGKLPRRSVKMLSQTPLIMRLLDTAKGAKASAEGGIFAAPHFFDSKHPNITPEIRKQIPEALVDPIAIFDSDSVDGRERGDLVFMLEVKDENGATVVVPVALNATDKLGAKINIAKSAYAKENNGKPSNSWFVDQANKNARYMNGQKWKRWSIGAGPNCPLVASNSHGKTVFTEKDLVKLREDNKKNLNANSGTARGGIRTLDDGRALVGLFQSRNASTVLHESAHFWLTQLREAMRLGTAPEWVGEAWAKLEKSYGFSGVELDPYAWREVQERFARDFEAYAREGKAPSWELQKAFDRFRNWLTEIYRSIKSLLGVHELSR